jgi:hypothetical protein
MLFWTEHSAFLNEYCFIKKMSDISVHSRLFPSFGVFSTLKVSWHQVFWNSSLNNISFIWLWLQCFNKNNWHLTRFTDLPVSKFCFVVFTGEFYKKIHFLDRTGPPMFRIERSILLRYIGENSRPKLNVQFWEIKKTDFRGAGFGEFHCIKIWNI